MKCSSTPSESLYLPRHDTMLGNNFAFGGGRFGHQDDHADAFLRPVSPLAGYAPASASASTSHANTNARFCDTDNLQAATDYLNSQLALSAFPSSSFTPQAPLVFLNANPHQAADLINLVFSLLQHRQRDAALRDDVDARMVRLENDYEAMAANLQRHKDKIAQDERELRAQLAKYSKLETAHREVTDKLKNTVDELKMVKAALVQAKNQFTHDKRKSERELSQLKLKFQKLSSDRFKDLKLNYKIANPGPYPAARTHAGPRRAAHPEDDYHSALLRDVEAREHALLGELDALKRLLHEVWIELQHLHSLAVPDLQVVDLPFELVRETVAFVCARPCVRCATSGPQCKKKPGAHTSSSKRGAWSRCSRRKWCRRAPKLKSLSARSRSCRGKCGRRARGWSVGWVPARAVAGVVVTVSARSSGIRCNSMSGNGSSGRGRSK
ncbi:Afadin and alpha-actinin-binding-domain-containing protein [Catenaria anguillulae PL171]|uniref:Afadin and alpha-actinin-binding-domain-containing protein n=1 Tax=Catenaria anguillulae PL171 TaxID=765915 RepID=A0A1Y2H676_9FUNG|nr:Afadin and alpha-actinin-binding-domain-containing protein [Catenaria anguillulae PL171]